MIVLLSLLLPKMYVPTIFHISPEKLAERGIKGILLDLDNTIVPRDQECFSEEVVAWLHKFREHNFKLCIISNNNLNRVMALAGSLNIPFIPKAIKPLRYPFRRAMEMIGTSPHETAVVGDQIFTDILGGNRIGAFTILVIPMKGKEFWATRLINRRLEKIVLYCLKRRMPGGTETYLVE